MKIDGISFNERWVMRFDNAETFAAHKMESNLWAGKPAAVRLELLKLVYHLVKIKHESNT